MRPIRKKRPVFAEINMVPFTDVVLVLLIIFMVTTPLILQGQIKVKLPTSDSQSAITQGPLTVTITKKGKIYLEDTSVSLSKLGALLKKELKKRREKTVIINGDMSARHGKVVAVLDLAKAAGAQKLAIATEQAPPGSR
jgi:biopolymer transport protein TolR